MSGLVWGFGIFAVAYTICEAMGKDYKGIDFKKGDTELHLQKDNNLSFFPKDNEEGS